MQRRKDRVLGMLHTLPERAQAAIVESLSEEDTRRYGVARHEPATERIDLRHRP